MSENKTEKLSVVVSKPKTTIEKKTVTDLVTKPHIKPTLKPGAKPVGRNVISRQKLLEHGVHFGHKKNRWNPKMKSYIQGIKHDTHIINLDKTVNSLNRAYKELYEITKKGGKILFVGTKKQASNSIKQNAIRSNSFYINHRWLGGTLTNFQTIRKSIERYKELERLGKDNFEGYSKKEAVDMYKEMKKMELALSGIKFMRHKPAAIVLSSAVEDNIAVKEAQKLNIPIFAIIDSNANPEGIEFKIPGNDDANKSQSLLITILADAICDANGLPKKAALVNEDEVEVLGINPREERPPRTFGRRPGGFGQRRFGDKPGFAHRPNRDSSFKRDENKLSTGFKPAASKPPYKPNDNRTTTGFKPSGPRPPHKPSDNKSITGVKSEGTKPPISKTVVKPIEIKLEDKKVESKPIVKIETKKIEKK